MRDEQEKPSSEELEERFGEDAELYADVRAEAAELSGRSTAAQQWERVSDCLRDEPDADE